MLEKEREILPLNVRLGKEEKLQLQKRRQQRRRPTRR
jgi:hypothetical protein